MRHDPLALIGRTVADKYEVESLVGQGGFALVYRAQHTIWRRPVALKVFMNLGRMSPERRKELVEGFVREGSVLAELSERSAAICQARDIGMLTAPDGSAMPFMVLEWLEGASLEAVLEAEIAQGLPPRTLGEAMQLLEPAIEGLILAHSRGIAHRDLKPGNLFLLGDPRGGSVLKILDFGIAKVVSEAEKEDFQKTLGKSIPFTPRYGAPEQFSRNYGATGPWTDVYAVALILLELMTQRPALAGDDAMQLTCATSNGARRPTPRAFGLAVTDGVEAVMTRAVAVKVEDRFQNAGELWNALRGVLGLEPLRVVGAQSDRRPSVSVPRVVVAHAPTLKSDGMSLPQTPRRADSLLSSVASAPTALAPLPRPVWPWIVLALGVAALGAGLFLARRFLVPHPTTAATASASASEVPPPPPPPPPTCPAGMIQIAAGRFFMGSDDKADFDFERPAHKVELGAFCIDRLEVTTRDYKACSDRGDCKRASAENEWEGITKKEKKTFDPLCNIREPEARGSHPINCVDWDQASEYCRQAGLRLPTEAEGEYATRGSDGRKYPWGDDAPTSGHLNACGTECVAWSRKNGIFDQAAMYKADDGFPNTAPVGSFPNGKSPFGVEDVVGNVWEWVADFHAPYTASAQTNPRGPESGDERVIRGGAWNGAEPSWVRPTFRYHDVAAKRSHGIGFRCAKGL